MLRSCTQLRPCFARQLGRTGGRLQQWPRHLAHGIERAEATATLSAPMLHRARSIAQEHSQLQAQLAADYQVATAKRVGELSSTAHAWARWEETTTSLHELQQILDDPASDAELRAIAAEELATTTQSVAAAATGLKRALVPAHPFAHLPCLIEIRPGTGGNEAGIFAGDLLRMYTAWCRRHQLRNDLIALTADETLGTDQITEAIVEVPVEGAYGRLRGEAGVHRVQRVPATESKGRVHTSAATLLVLPSFPEHPTDTVDVNDPASDYYVAPADVRVDVMRARGAGGQHVNTTDSAVRLTHEPTGTVVAVQTSRSQQQNRARAWQILRARLAQRRREAREAEVAAVRRGIAGVGKADRSDKVRTYNWGQRRVTEHRSGVTTYALDDVLAGGPALDGLMASVQTWLMEQELAALAADEAASA